MSRPTFISLFTGVGGLDLGLDRAGFECVAQVEESPWRRRVLAKRWPHVQQFNDVRTFNRGSISGNVHLIAGGDPCQENSNARQAHDTLSPSLGGEFIRVVDEFRPLSVLRENPARVRGDAPWPWWRFRARLEALGYLVLPFRLRACCCGADHERCRLFVFAYLPDADEARLQGHERQELAGTNGREEPDADATGPDRWYATPRICRRTDGVPNRVDRLKALGDAVAPAVGEWIGRRILAAMEEVAPC